MARAKGKRVEVERLGRAGMAMGLADPSTALRFAQDDGVVDGDGMGL
ncbi:MAG: hypothetical protein ABI142_12755 [Bryocella sp.]